MVSLCLVFDASIDDGDGLRDLPNLLKLPSLPHILIAKVN
jgi:hypothetical protein